MKQGRNGEGGQSLVKNQRFKNPQKTSFEGTLDIGFVFFSTFITHKPPTLITQFDATSRRRPYLVNSCKE